VVGQPVSRSPTLHGVDSALGLRRGLVSRSSSARRQGSLVGLRDPPSTSVGLSARTPRTLPAANVDLLRRACRALHPPFASPSRLSPLRSGALSAPPLLGFAAPLRRHPVCTSTPGRLAPSFGPMAAKPMKSRSALVVSLHLDGFRRASGRGLVASHCRPWGSLCFGLHSPSLLADCSARRPGEPGPSSQCTFPSESVLAGSRYRVPAALCPLAVAPPCSLAGSAQVRRTPCQGSRPLARTSSPRGPRVHFGPPLARLSTSASHRKRHPCLKTGPATTSRLEWGCSGRFPGPPQPPSPSTCACAPYEGPGHRSGCSCLRRGWALLPCDNSAARNRSPAKPRTSPSLARWSRPGSGAFSTSPAPCTVASPRSRLVLRDSLGLEALLRRRVPNPLPALRLGLDSLLPWVSIPLPKSSSPQPAPARAGALRRAAPPLPPLARRERPTHHGGPRVPSYRKLPSHSAGPWAFAHFPASGCPCGPFRDWISRSHSGSLRTRSPPERDGRSPGRLQVRSRGPS
jgi:hypothetical protein